LLWRLGGREAVLHQQQSRAKFVVIERRPAWFSSFGASGVHAVARTLGDEAALELSYCPASRR
jgi:hypothetical protein